MTAVYETTGFDWHGIAVSVTFCPDWCRAWSNVHGFPLYHIEVTSAGRVPLPMTQTGYLSLFVSGAVMDEWGGPLPYVRHGMDASARDPAWRNRETALQLTLF